MLDGDGPYPDMARKLRLQYPGAIFHLMSHEKLFPRIQARREDILSRVCLLRLFQMEFTIALYRSYGSLVFLGA